MPELSSCCVIDWTRLLPSRHRYHHCTTVAVICAISQVVAFSTTVRYYNYSHNNNNNNKSKYQSSSLPNDSPPNFQRNTHSCIESFVYSNLQTVKMSSSIPAPPHHDEIAKAIAAAAEMRDISSKDEAPTTIFDKIIAGDIPCNKVYEDDIVLAFHDVNPVAPVHILVIPKVRNGLTQISKSSTHEHQATLGHAMMVASQIGKQYCKDNGFRIVINDGEHGGQSVYHLHIHVIGGRQMQWPPG